MLAKRIACMLVTIMIPACVGCGQPLYPERSFSVTLPNGGRVDFSSTQEEEITMGPVELETDVNGVKTFKLGTTTQPALTYGAKSVGAMKEYAQQQLNYVLILKQLGDNAVNSINAIGDAASKVIGGLVAFRAQSAASGNTAGCALADSLIADVQDLQAKARAAKTLIEAANDLKTSAR